MDINKLKDNCTFLVKKNDTLYNKYNNIINNYIQKLTKNNIKSNNYQENDYYITANYNIDFDDENTIEVKYYENTLCSCLEHAAKITKYLNNELIVCEYFVAGTKMEKDLFDKLINSNFLKEMKIEDVANLNSIEIRMAEYLAKRKNWENLIDLINQVKLLNKLETDDNGSPNDFAINIKGTCRSEINLPVNGKRGDAYLVNNLLYVYDDRYTLFENSAKKWICTGKITGF